MDIFIAGATGVMGRRAVPVLIEGGHQVTAAGRNREKLEALEVPAGAYNVSDDVPLRRCEVARAFGAALDIAAPRLPPRWMGKLGGSLGEALARSQRISNHKLKAASDWRPKYPSLYEGLPAALEKL